MRSRTFLRLAVLLPGMLAACAHSAPVVTTPVVVASVGPASGCQEVGVVRGEGGGVFGAWQRNATIAERAREDAMTKAGRLGATHLVTGPVAFQERGGTATRASVVGQAYRCDVAVAAPSEGRTDADPTAVARAGGGGEPGASSAHDVPAISTEDAPIHGGARSAGDALGIR